MSDAPVIGVSDIVAFERPVTFRMPFRFGAAKVEGTSQAFVRLRVTDRAGRSAIGWSAEMMMPKWFDKSPDLSAADNIEQLRQSVRIAMAGMAAAGSGTAFGLHAALEAAHHAACAAAGLNGLIASFGLALLDRAVIDAVCRLEKIPAAVAVRENRLGITSATAPDLEGFDLNTFLAARPSPSLIAIRHTVGLGDVLTDGELETPLGDGLPETLEQVIARNGHRWFKIKVSGQPEADVARLVRIAAVLGRRAPDYAITMDGNEQCAGPEVVIELLDRIAAEPRLATFASRVSFLEQPIARASALGTPMHQVAARIGLEIDESDADMAAFPAATKLGYTGISSKSCKGFYRALLNAARVAKWNGEGGPFFMSAEDLTTQAGIGIQQDLVLASLVSASHIERNGHHYVDGMASAPGGERTAFLARHGDLYASANGNARLAIRDGSVALGSALGAVGLGSAVEPDWSGMSELAGVHA